MDPHNSERLVDPEVEKYWMPVQLYVGGAEHAVLHLLYARFWHKFLYDIGVVSTDEPFHKLVNQGMILGEDGQKMSKSRGNVVNPDDVIDARGSDAMRLYEMFMGPLEAVKPWSTKDIVGIARFLDRAWKVGLKDRVDGAGDDATVRLTHRTVKKVTEDIDGMRFNTAISALMIMVNELTKLPQIPEEALSATLRCLCPFAPHIAEELWSRMGHETCIAEATWPTFEEALCADDEIELVVQVNGKVRSRLTVAKDTGQDELRAMALADSRIAKWTHGKVVRKVIVVPNKIVNIVVT